MSFENLGRIIRLFDDFRTNGGSDGNDFGKILKQEGLKPNDVSKFLPSILKTADGLGDDFLEGVFEEFGEEGVEAFQKLIKEGTTFGEKFSNITKRIKDLGSGIWSAITTNWVAVAAAAAVATIAIIAYNNSFDKLCENAQESKAALEETASQIGTLQNQKQSNQDKIAELSKFDSSDYEDEIKALERQNALLQAKITLKEKLEEDQRKEAAEDAYKALSKQFVVSDIKTDEFGIAYTETEYKDIVDLTSDDIFKLDELQQKYNDVTDQLAAYNKKKEEGNELTEAEEDEFENLTNKAESYSSAIDNLESDIDENKSTILGLYESLLNTDGTAITGFETMANKILAIFPELADGSYGLSENLKSISDTYSKAVGGDSDLVKEFDYWLLGLSETDQNIVYDLYCNTDTAEYSLQEWQDVLAETKAQIDGLSSVPIDISAETSGIESVTSAISETASATGLAAETISTLKSRYKGLENYDPSELFENTATGVRVNTRELSRLEKQYENLNRQKIADSLENLYDEYDRLTDKIKKHSGVSDTAVEDLEAQRDAVLDDIESVKLLASEYSGLTSAYNEWVNAQSANQSGSWYDSAKEGLDSLKELYMSGDYGNTALQEGLEYFTGTNITGIDDWHKRMQAVDAAYKQLNATIDGTNYSINDFMAGGQDGCNNYLQAIRQLGKGWADFDTATNSWELNYNKFDLAAQLGTSVEFIEMMQDKLEQFGFQFDTTSATQSAETLEGKILEIQHAVNSFGSESVDIPITIDSPSEQLEYVKSLIDEVNASDVSPEVKEEQLNSLYAMVDRLVGMVNQPAFMEIDVSQVDESLQEPISLLQEYQNAVNNVETLKIKGADTSDLDAANAKVSELANQLATLDKTTLLNLGFNLDGIDSDNLAVELEAQIPTLEIPVKFTSNSETQDTTNGSQVVTVVYERDTTQIDEYIPTVDPVTVTYIRDSLDVDSFDPPNLKRTVTYDIKTNGFVPGFGQHGVNGTANVSGTARLNGDWGTAAGGRTLVGELGREIIVDPYTNRWHTVGDNGAEFVNVPHGAIVFNHLQTKSLLSQGHVSGRGKALISGNAAAMEANSITTTGGGSLTLGNSSQTKKSDSESNSSKVVKEAKESVDWIEIAIKRVQEAFSRIATVAENTFSSLATKIAGSKDKATLLNKELSIQEKAFNRYMKEANAVGLDSDLAELVKNGAINISQYDEDTQKQISAFQEWYNKAIEASDATLELKQSIAQLHKEKFDNISSDFDNQLEMIEHSASISESRVDAIEERGYLVGKKSYEALIAVENRRLDLLNSKLENLQTSFAEAMASGDIEEYSDDWYDMQSSINDTKEEIEDVNLSVIELGNSMRDLEWEKFDILHDQISQITDESDFLIELLSSSKLHTDNGQFTDEGMAAVGLHAMNYNTYMAQSENLAKELLDINEELADDPSNKTLLERRKELLDLQHDSILAAEGEKQAIIDLVEEGINLELESVKELIDSYVDALDNAKSLYDYQNKINDQTSKISALRKQLWAYENDGSEETRAKVQSLRVELSEAETDLKEAEYDQYISDQKKMLDNLYLEFESVLNSRLDNVNALFTELIVKVNENATSINTTISQTAGTVGYDLSQNMKGIWDGSISSLNGVVSTYGNGFSSQLTSVNYILQQIQIGVANMAADIEEQKEEENKKNPPETPKTEDAAPEVSVENTTNVEVKPSKDSNSNESDAGNKPSTSTNPTSNPKPSGIKADKSGLNNNSEERMVVWEKEEKKKKATTIVSGSGGGSKTWQKVAMTRYATGGLADYTGLAILDGTPNKPELVLNPEDTKNYLALTDVLREMTSRDFAIGHALPYQVEPMAHDIGSVDYSALVSKICSQTRNDMSNDISVTFGDINIDHVEDYNDFVNQLRNDKKFEKMIHAITFDRATGGNSLAKNKLRW